MSSKVKQKQEEKEEEKKEEKEKEKEEEEQQYDSTAEDQKFFHIPLVDVRTPLSAQQQQWMEASVEYQRVQPIIEELRDKRRRVVHDLQRLEQMLALDDAALLDLCEHIFQSSVPSMPLRQYVPLVPFVDLAPLEQRVLQFEAACARLPPVRSTRRAHIGVAMRASTATLGTSRRAVSSAAASAESVVATKTAAALEGRAQKNATFNAPWTDEEQALLERLLVEYPDEPVKTNRWRKIAKAMGTRTRKQVASRTQRYFLKLAQEGKPVPGTLSAHSKLVLARQAKGGARKRGASKAKSKAALAAKKKRGRKSKQLVDGRYYRPPPISLDTADAAAETVVPSTPQPPPALKNDLAQLDLIGTPHARGPELVDSDAAAAAAAAEPPTRTRSKRTRR